MTRPPPTSAAGALTDSANPAPAPPPTPRGRAAIVRLVLWVIMSAGLVLGLPAWFYMVRDGRILQRLDLLHTGWMALAAACLGLWMLLLTTPRQAIRLSPRLGKRLILLLTAVVAAGGLLWLKPVLSPEVLRYRFEGRIWLLGLNPYQVSPSEAADLAADTEDPELRPDLLDLAAPGGTHTSLNLPVSQAAFVATRTLEYLSPQSAEGRVLQATTGPARASAAEWRSLLLELPWWRTLFFWRCLLAGAFLLTVGEMIAWLRHRGLSPWWAAVFAWQPLVLVETIGAGHQEMLGVLFLVAGLRRTDMGNFRRAGICLAAAVAVKPLALLVLPFVLRRAWRGDKLELDAPAGTTPFAGSGSAARRTIAWFGATLVVLLAPIWVVGAIPDLLSATGSYFASQEHDASLYRLLETMFVGAEASSERVARVRLATWMLCALAVGLAGLVSWLRHVRPAAAFYAMTMSGLLLSPASGPWMLIWPLAMVPVLHGRAGLAALVWAGTAALHYLPETLLGNRAPGQIMMLGIVPVYVAAVLESIAASRHAARLQRNSTEKRAAGA